MRVGEGCLGERGAPGDGGHQGLCRLALEGCSAGEDCKSLSLSLLQSTVKLLLKTSKFFIYEKCTLWRVYSHFSSTHMGPLPLSAFRGSPPC